MSNSSKKVFHTSEAEILSLGMLFPEEVELIEAARQTRNHAQAPYSGYLVGVAVKSAKTGKIYTGVNVECATYTQTTHGEQAAITAMVAAEGPGTKIAMLACAAGPREKEITYAVKVSEKERQFCNLPAPCGHCLQIIWENCADDPNVVLLYVTAEGEICRMTIGDVFPVRFGPKDLGIT